MSKRFKVDDRISYQGKFGTVISTYSSGTGTNMVDIKFDNNTSYGVSMHHCRRLVKKKKRRTLWVVYVVNGLGTFKHVFTREDTAKAMHPLNKPVKFIEVIE